MTLLIVTLPSFGTRLKFKNAQFVLVLEKMFTQEIMKSHIAWSQMTTEMKVKLMKKKLRVMKIGLRMRNTAVKMNREWANKEKYEM